MDWGTHIVLASKILEVCGLDKGASIYSDLPAIDSKPPEFHRVYAHILENQPVILDAARDIFQNELTMRRDFGGLNKFLGGKIIKLEAQLANAPSKERRKLEQRIYAYTRIVEDAPEFLKLVDQASNSLNESRIASLSADKLSAGVSVITHIFFDTFNNPVQAFLPYSSLASAQWDLWDSIDYLGFRENFYRDENINRFRKEVADDSIWDVKLNPKALLKAMIIRVGEQGRPPIPYKVIDWVIRKFLRYIDINEYQRVDKEIKFLRRLEDRIKEIISRDFPKEEGGP